MNDKKVRVTELFDCTVPYLENLFDGCEYPWEMLPKLGKYIENLIKDGIKGFELLSDGVLVGKDVKIYENVTIEPPAIIGDGCVLRPGAFLRGNVVLGNGAHLGAGAICSNLKSDKTAVRVKTDNAVYDTGIRKFGAALADNADVGCGCVLNPGTVVGKNTRIYPLVSVRGVIPSDRIVKSAECLVKKEVRPCAE